MRSAFPEEATVPTDTASDIAGWLIILSDATAEHDIDGITEARSELDRLLRQPVHAP